MFHLTFDLISFLSSIFHKILHLNTYLLQVTSVRDITSVLRKRFHFNRDSGSSWICQHEYDFDQNEIVLCFDRQYVPYKGIGTGFQQAQALGQRYRACQNLFNFLTNPLECFITYERRYTISVPVGAQSFNSTWLECRYSISGHTSEGGTLWECPPRFARPSVHSSNTFELLSQYLRGVPIFLSPHKTAEICHRVSSFLLVLELLSKVAR